MSSDFIEICIRLTGALGVGALIGLERSYRGRPAGFRTHALVCVASSLLMLVTVYESQWFQPAGNSRVVVDPTRMAQGIMTGIGFYIPAALATVLTLGTLSGFRWIEGRMRTEQYAIFSVRLNRGHDMGEDELRRLVTQHGFSVAHVTYRLRDEGENFEYRMALRTLDTRNLRALANALAKIEAVKGFQITPTND